MSARTRLRNLGLVVKADELYNLVYPCLPPDTVECPVPTFSLPDLSVPKPAFALDYGHCLSRYDASRLGPGPVLEPAQELQARSPGTHADLFY